MAPAAPTPVAALHAPSSSSAFSSSFCGSSLQPSLHFRNPLHFACSSKANEVDVRFVHGGAILSLPSPSSRLVRARAETDDNGAEQPADDPEVASPSPSPSLPQQKQSLLEALDFSAVRSEEDAQLLEDARSATSVGEKMSREQYAALRRKVGGTYRDFFKDSIEVDGEFVDEGWVDKSCRFCKKDTASEPRTVDKFGRYAHVTCLEKSKSGNFLTRLFGM